MKIMAKIFLLRKNVMIRTIEDEKNVLKEMIRSGQIYLTNDIGDTA